MCKYREANPAKKRREKVIHDSSNITQYHTNERERAATAGKKKHVKELQNMEKMYKK